MKLVLCSISTPLMDASMLFYSVFVIFYSVQLFLEKLSTPLMDASMFYSVSHKLVFIIYGSNDLKYMGSMT